MKLYPAPQLPPFPAGAQIVGDPQQRGGAVYAAKGRALTARVARRGLRRAPGAGVWLLTSFSFAVAATGLD